MSFGERGPLDGSISLGTLQEIADVINEEMKITTAREVGRVVARCERRRRDAEVRKAARAEAPAEKTADPRPVGDVI